MNEPLAGAGAPRGPLTGYTVLELCSTIAGPVCARLFADFGADVIKVEPAEQGIDVVTSSVQGVLGPPAMTPAQINYWGSALAEICKSDEWKEFLAKNQWQPNFVGPEQAGATSWCASAAMGRPAPTRIGPATA